MHWLVDYWLDAAMFGLLLWSSALVCHLWLRKRYPASGFRGRFWLKLGLLTVSGVLYADRVGDHERNYLRDAVSGIAPTYAKELELMGHAKITGNTLADDPVYVRAIEAQIRWLKANPVVNDIYTLRRDADGTVRLIVDSETDYNHNGQYDEDREARTAIGETYEEVTENMSAALGGVAMFDSIPETDRWGTWVSAYMPIFNPNGTVDAILGVDYDANSWLQRIALSRLTALSVASVLGVIIISAGMSLAINNIEIERRRRVEAALRTSESRLRTILDNEPECVKVLEINPAGKVLEINPAGLAMLDVSSAEELSGKPFIDFVEATDQPAFERFHARASAGERVSLQFQVIGKTGSKRWLESQAVPLIDEKGAVTAVLSVARDITQRKTDEKERERLQAQLMETSRQAGMAEIAIGVLHNVGNVLNSVNVSAGVVNEKLRQSKVAGFTKAAQMIQQHEQDLPQFLAGDEKGKQLPGYLVKLSQFLSDEHSAMMGELQSMTKGLEHIKEVVRMQQSFAKTASTVQPLLPSEVFDEAAKVNLISMDKHSIELVREFQNCGEVLIDKHQTLQILINLIGNAKNAVKENPDSTKQITLRLRKEMHNDLEQIVFEVTDTGVGIDQQLFTRIFQHGFTTRREGHGFGLHSAANSARAMGGRLSCHSDGPGTGATFTLVLPARSTHAEAA